VNQVLNISGYKFVALGEPQVLRLQMHASAMALGLLGTVLLADEGINLVLAGAAGDIDGFLQALRADERFADLQVTQTWSAAQPFRRLRVKVKREIIRMNQPAIRPAQQRAPAVDPATAKRWLDRGRDDEGRPLLLLDTRNAFEVEHGSFAGALDWRLRSFGEFPQALAAHRGDLEGKTVLSFCTGGIRCEKAALHMRASGVENVWQLDGGILKYLQETGGAHFEGSCFVFDERESLDAGLTATRQQERLSPGGTIAAHHPIPTTREGDT
jgi:UPF0176 protein